jgi:hypothetical protein
MESTELKKWRIEKQRKNSFAVVPALRCNTTTPGIVAMLVWEYFLLSLILSLLASCWRTVTSSALLLRSLVSPPHIVANTYLQKALC